MKQFTEQIPKALIPVAGRPFVHHQLDLMESQGFRGIVVAIGHKGSMIVEELSNHPHQKLSIEFIDDGDTLLGTGGAIRRIVENLIDDEYFFITYGDSYLKIDVNYITNIFDRSKFDALMTLYSNKEYLDINNACLNADGSARYQKNAENPESIGLDMVDYGLSLVSRSSILEIIPKNVSYDLATYFQIVSERNRLQGVSVSHRFYEIGSMTGRDNLEDFLLKNVAN